MNEPMNTAEQNVEEQNKLRSQAAEILNMVEGNAPLANKLLEELKGRGVDILGMLGGAENVGRAYCGDPDCPSCGSGRLEGIPGIPLGQFRGIPTVRVVSDPHPHEKLEGRLQALGAVLRTFDRSRAQTALTQLEGIIGAALMQGPDAASEQRRDSGGAPKT